MKKLHWFVLSLSVCIVLISACEEDDPPSLTYLALGDSYTIGEGVEEAERWPVQLSERLTEMGTKVWPPDIVAQTGWRTSSLKAALTSSNDLDPRYNLVSLLIGVNNQFWGEAADDFEPKFEELLELALFMADDNQNRVFVLSIPDYGVTPFGRSRGPQVSREIDEYNAVCRRVCAEFGILFLDITPISRQAESNPNLLASDNLHPSGEMYALWVEAIQAEVLEMLRKP